MVILSASHMGRVFANMVYNWLASFLLICLFSLGCYPSVLSEELELYTSKGLLQAANLLSIKDVNSPKTGLSRNIISGDVDEQKKFNSVSSIEALNSLELIKLDEKSPRPLFLRAALYVELFTKKRQISHALMAIRDLDALRILDKDAKFENLGQFYRAKLYYSLDNLAEARNTIKDFLKVTTGDAKVHGEILLELINAKLTVRSEIENQAVSREGLPLVIIDPGHGGKDIGASGRNVLLEKDVVLDIALRVRDKASGFRVKLTRDSDVYLTLNERTALANDADADLFVSLHVNSSGSGRAYGLQTYILDNTQNKSAIRLAEIENGENQTVTALESDLNFIVSDIVQANKSPDSRSLALALHEEILQSVNLTYQNPYQRIDKAPFYVLVGARMPCVLLELFFIDNKRDRLSLMQDNFKDQIANGIVAGIARFIQTRSKGEVIED